MPLKPFARHSGVFVKTVDDPRHRPRKRDSRVWNPESHSVAHSDLCGHAFFCRHVLYSADERDHESVEVRPRYVLEMAARSDACLKSIVHDRQIMIDRLLARHAELVEDVVVGAACQNARFLDTHLLDDLEILFFSSDPCGDLREFKSQVLTGSYGFLISVRISEELGLPDYALRARELRHHFEDIDYLFGGVWLPRLLAVAEC